MLLPAVVEKSIIVEEFAEIIPAIEARKFSEESMNSSRRRRSAAWERPMLLSQDWRETA